jgi:uncharacterized protein YndB with AHSA1/START domain
MSEVHQQALIEAPVADVWDLVGNPRRYPEWWPRVVEVQGQRYDTGDAFVQVMRQPFAGRTEAHFLIDRMDDLREISLHCTLSGTFVTFQLTDARDDTFLDAAFGMDPINSRSRLFDATLGRRFFRRWLDESVEAIETHARGLRA